MEPGWKHAASSKMRFVRPLTSVLAPPMTPATPIACSASAISSMPSASARAWPSSVVNGSPARARRTTIVARASVA